MVSLRGFLLDPSVSQPISVWRESMEANLVAPVTILAASFWILSNSFDSYCGQLFHTTSAYISANEVGIHYHIFNFAAVRYFSKES